MSSSKKVVLLTGGSRGIGLGVLKLLLSGVPASSSSSAYIPATAVVTISRSITQDLKALQSAYPNDLICIQGDVTDPKVNELAVARAVETWGSLNSVILNAAVVVTEKIAHLTPESFAHTMNVNTLSLVTTIRSALTELRRANGTVVFVSSGAASGNTAGWAAYNASKAAMNAIARTLANEEPDLAVFAIGPGVVDTDMAAIIRSDGHKSMKPEELSRFLTMHKEGSLLKPEQPGFTIAALATTATRTEPKSNDGEGLGAQGAFVNWNADELSAFKQ